MVEMMLNIRKHLVSENIAKRVTYNGTNSKKYIVIHETANTRKGANANAHARLQASGNSRQASWHYQVDDKEIIQSFEDDVQCWGAGNRYYNENGIQIEICVNSDGNFKKAVDNAAKLTKHLMDKYNIPASNVIQHNQASGKNCPRYLRSGEKGVSWGDFKAKLAGKKETKAKSSTKQKKPDSKPKTTNKSISQMAQEVIDGKHGNGHENRRRSLGIDKATYEKVRAEVNRRLTGKSTIKKPTKSISQMATEVIQGKHGNGHEQRRKSLGIDKATYEKVRKEVNRRFK